MRSPRPDQSLASVHALAQLAIARGIPVHEPFQGQRIGEFTVMSPSRTWYVEQLMADIEESLPDRIARLNGTLRRAIDSAAEVLTGIAESWGIETLHEGVSTSADNESSVVLFGMPADRGVLLTGDAGPRALTLSALYAESCGISLPEVLKFIQVPHHGSRRNVSPSVLDRLIGRKLPAPLPAPKCTAFVSAGKHSATHPRKAVINAFMRRGAKIIATKGSVKSHRFNMDPRTGWIQVTPMNFSSEVEPWA